MNNGQGAPGWFGTTMAKIRPWLMPIIGIYIAVVLTVVLFNVLGNAGRNNKQDQRIENLISSQAGANLRGCEIGNERTEEQNRRLPVEKVELSTAILVSTIAERFNLHVEGVDLDPESIRELRRGLNKLKLRDCEAVYGPASRISERKDGE